MINIRTRFPFPRILGFVICLWLLPSMVFAQIPLPHIVPSEKILNTTIPSVSYDIEIDSNGYIYFGGPIGIRKFNGIELERVEIKGESKYKRALTFFKDAKERIWVKFFQAGLGIVSDSGCIPYKYTDTISQFDRLHLEDLYEDSAGVLHLAPRGKGYFKVMPTGELVEVFTPIKDLNGFVIYEIEGKPFIFSSFSSSKEKRLLGLDIYYWKGGDSIHKITHLESVNPIHKSTLVTYPNGNYVLSIGTMDIIEFSKETFVQYLKSPGNITDLFIDRDETMWIGTDYSGIYRMTDSIIDIEHPIQANTPAAVMAQDKDGGLWLNSRKKYFYYMPSAKTSSYDEELPKLRELGISFQDTDGDKVYLIHSGGKDLVVLEEDTVKRIPFPQNVDLEMDFRKSSGPSSIEYDSIRNWIWVGFDCYVLAYDGSDWHTFVIPKVDFLDNGRYMFRSMTVRPDGALVAVSYPCLFIVGADGSRSVKKISKNEDGIYHPHLIESDKKGRLWISAENGLWCIDNDSCFRPKVSKEYAREIEKVVTFFQRGLGRIWFLSHDFKLFSIVNDSVSPFQIIEGKELAIIDLTTDTEGNLWGRPLQGENNYFKIEKQNANFDIELFGQSVLFEKNAGFRHGIFAITKQKIFYQHGSQIFTQNLNELDSFPVNPSIIIKDVFINDLAVKEKDFYELESDQNSLRFYYDPISHIVGDLEYRHRLIGYSDKWRISKVSSVQYTNLDPGKYRFELEVHEMTSPWVGRKTIDLYIKTPFWQTWWFISLIVLVGIGLIGASFYLWFRNRARRSELTIAKLMADQRALRAQMNPHFLFNTLVSIQELVFNNGPVVAAKNISMFATLMRKILVQSSQETIPLHDEIEMLTLYVKLESLRFDDSFSYNISVDDGIDKNGRMIPPMLIQPFVENAIKHGLQNQSPKGGNIQISFKSQDNGLICTISDDGVGMRATSGNKNDHKSFSLNAIRERIEILNMRSGEEIKLEISDKVENSKGTQISLYLP